VVNNNTLYKHYSIEKDRECVDEVDEAE